jgi:hypothetical protein
MERINVIERHRGLSDKPIRQSSADLEFTTNVDEGRSKQTSNAFKDGHVQFLPSAWNGLNEKYWTHGLTISAGRDWNVSEQRARDRLTFLALRLKRKIWGNNRQKQRKIELLVFKHSKPKRLKHSLAKRHGKGPGKRSDPSGDTAGSAKLVGVHWHALMAIKGKHGWSNQQITDAINEIERNSKMRLPSEKTLYVDFDWEKDNAVHRYIAREERSASNRWEIEKKAKREAKSTSEWRYIERHFEKTKIDKNIGDGYFIMSL